MEYFIDALKKYANFTGRAQRKEYWMFILFYFIFYVVLSVIGNVIGTLVLSLIYSFALFIPGLSIAARRLHDTGKSGWWQLIILIPIFGLIVLIVFFVQDSHPDNEYGANPKLE